MTREFDDQWYAVAPSIVVTDKTPFRLTLFSKRMVLWRTLNGSVFALDDNCPHLGASLSGGRLVEQTVVCPYHGLRFDVDGSCVHIPAEPKADTIPRKMRLRRWAVCERDGWIFLLWGDFESEKPSLPQLTGSDDTRSKVAFHSARDWPVCYSQVVENTLDPLHFAEVHRALRIPVLREKDLVVRCGDRTIEQVGVAGKADFSVSLIYPNLWRQRIGRWGTASIAIVPQHENETRLYLQTSLTWSKIPFIRHVLGFCVHKLYEFALWQDSNVVFEQVPNAKLGGQDILLGYDKMIIEYRKMHQRL